MKGEIAISANEAGMDDTVVRDGICQMCGVCCPTRIHVRQGKATRIDIADPRLAICPRWRAQLDFVYHPDRLKYPLKRVGERGNGSFVRISWDEALDTIASRLQGVAREYGPESVVVYVSYPKEPRPYYHRLTHAFGSPNYCTESSNCFSATWLATILTYGSDYGLLVAMPSMAINPLSKCKLIWGSGIRHSLPEFWKEYLAAKQSGLKLIVVDPRRTKIASMADVHLQLRPGTDGALALGLINVIINQQLYDKDFVGKWTNGFDDLRKLAQQYSPAKVASITSVPAARIIEAATLYATRKPASVTSSLAATTHCSNGVQNHRAIILLPALTGNLDIKGGNRGQAPPAAPLNRINLHERVTSLPPGLGSERFPLWTGQYEEMQSNTLAHHIETGTPYPIKALFGAGLNTTFFPNSNRLVENLKKLDFIAVTEYFHNTGTQLADIVLPIASWLERPILLTRGSPIRLIEPAIEPLGESWPEWEIIAGLARRLGIGDEFWDGDFNRCLDYILEPSGITVDDLKKHPEGIEYPGTPRPEKHYEQVGFQTPSGKVEIASSILAQYGHDPLPVYVEPAESPLSRPDLASSFPLVLTSGARTIAFTHSQHRNIPRLRKIVPEPRVEINPADAGPRGIKSGDMVVLSSPRGSIRLKAKVSDIILPGAVHAPHNWPGEANVNILVDDQNLDPISGFAPYKSQLCQVAKA
jgi:anaerobic selenocysteine-containing dehydrogenase